MASMTHADAAAAALAEAIGNKVRTIGPSVTALKTARESLSTAPHITDAFLAAGALILALEGLEAVSKDCAGDCRQILRDAMADAGCYSLGGEAFGLVLADAPRSVMITDPQALAAARPDLMTTPEPKPDRKAVEAALKAGPVPGAAISNGGPSVLRINTKRGK